MLYVGEPEGKTKFKHRDVSTYIYSVYRHGSFKQTFQSWLLQTWLGQQSASHLQPNLQQPVYKE